MKSQFFLKWKPLIISGFMALFLHSCQKDDFYDQNNTSSKNIKVQRLKFSDLQKHPKVLEKIEVLTNRKSNYQARMVEMPQYEFTVDTDEIIFIEADTLLSYTFRIFREDDNGLLENLVLKPSENGNSYDAFLFQYDFSQEDIERYQNGQLILNQQDKTQITYLPDFDETPLYNARAGENGEPLFPLPTGCAWEFVESSDYEIEWIDGYGHFSYLTWWQPVCNGGGGSGSSNGDGSSNGGWTGSGNSDSGSSNGNGNSDGMTSGGGVGGTGNGQNTSPLVTVLIGLDGQVSNDNCNDLKNKTTFTEYKEKIDELKQKATDQNFESGYITYSGDPKFSQEYQADPNVENGSMIEFPLDTSRDDQTGFIHCHLDDPTKENFAIFSLTDLLGFAQIIDTSTAPLSSYTLMVTSAKGTFALKITNKNKFIAMVNALGDNWGMSEWVFQTHYVKKEDSVNDQIEGFLKFFRQNADQAIKNSGFEFYSCDNNFKNWTKHELNNNNTVKTKKC